MAKTEKPPKDKPTIDVTALRTLLEHAVKLAEQQQLLLAEMQAIAAGKEGVGAKMRKVSDGFLAAWATRYGGKYVWNGAEDSPACKRLLQRLEPEELIKRAQRYIARTDDFYLRERHPFRFFARNINTFADDLQIPFDADPTGVADCKHDPPCRSDQEHTRKRAKEMR